MNAIYFLKRPPIFSCETLRLRLENVRLGATSRLIFLIWSGVSGQEQRQFGDRAVCLSVSNPLPTSTSTISLSPILFLSCPPYLQRPGLVVVVNFPQVSGDVWRIEGNGAGRAYTVKHGRNHQPTFDSTHGANSTRTTAHTIIDTSGDQIIF